MWDFKIPEPITEAEYRERQLDEIVMIKETNKAPAPSTIEYYTVMITKYQRQVAGNIFLIGQALKEAKESGLFENDKHYSTWVQDELGIVKGTANKMIQVYNRFGTMSSQASLSDSKLIELVSFPEYIQAEDLLSMAKGLTVKEIREWKADFKEVKEPSSPDYLKSICTAHRKAIDILPAERLIKLYEEMIEELKSTLN